jgi:RNA polymerase sigma-70 factor (ECF subfamily)
MLNFYLSIIEDESDKKFFERIYLQYSDDIFRRIYGILRNMQDTEDAMQDTWHKIYVHVSKLRDMNENVLCAYIMSAAKNHAITILRKRKKEESFLCDTDVGDVADDISDDVFFTSCDGIDEERLISCMEKLGEIYTDVLIYYYVHGHSIKEIARLMNISAGTVGSRLARGRRMLYELMKGGKEDA